MRRPFARPTDPWNTPGLARVARHRALTLSSALVAVALPALLGCAGNGGNGGSGGPNSERPAAPRSPGLAREVPSIDDAEFRRDPIRAFREPVYAIEGRPAVLFPAPPGDLMSWWIPPMPDLREADSGRALNARLVWLAGSGGATGTHADGLAWLGGASGAGAARWSSLNAPEAARLAGSASPADRARLGDSGIWVVLVEGLRTGETIALRRAGDGAEAGNGDEPDERLAIRRLAALPEGPSDLSSLHPPHWSAFDRAASARLAAALASAWRDPMQRWRVRLLADRFAGDGSFVTPLAGDGAGDPVVDEIAAQFERLWREGLGTLMRRDASLAAEVFGGLLPLVELSPGTPLPVWRAEPATEWALLAALLDGQATTERVRSLAGNLRETRPAMIGWITQDAEPTEHGFDAANARASVAELHGRARRAAVEGGRATTPGSTVPGLGTAWFAIDLGPSPAAASRPLTMRSGALSQPMAIAPRAAPVLPPRYVINGLWRAWTAESFLNAQPSPALAIRDERPTPTAAAIITRDPVHRRWVLFVECLRDPAATRGDELRIWFDTPAPIVVDANGVLRGEGPAGTEVQLLAHESLADRWSATLAFPDPNTPRGERDDEDAGFDGGFGPPVRFALQRSEHLNTGGTRTSSWPRPKFPHESPDTPPGTIGLDLGAWDREMAGVPSFDGRARDERRERDALETRRAPEPLPELLPGPLP